MYDIFSLIELDGSQHYEGVNAEKETERTAFPEGYGLTVIRIPNNEVTRNFRGVCEYDVVKKHGGAKVSTGETLRKDLVEEMADVLMYYNDIMLCYGITADELKQAYRD